MKIGVLLLFLLWQSFCSISSEQKQNKRAGTSDRLAKLLPVFQVVRFPNSVCEVSGGSKNGTCYTEEECANKGGTTQGTCAEGFGVCCVFTLGCGAQTNENCTYFEEANKAITAGPCQARICKMNANICQFRIDFETFVITGPSTNSDDVLGSVGAVPSVIIGTGDNVATATKCLTDTFSVSNQFNLPAICGTVSGEHVYVDASDMCNDLVFQFGTTAIGVTTLATRQFSLKVTQFNCAYENRAPQGCDQYFFGASGTGIINSFNFQNSIHLAGQDQTICFRREKNNCRLCFSADAAADVKLSNGAAAIAANVKAEDCCGAGVAGDNTGFDCLIIPGASKGADSKPAPQSQCSGGKGVYTASGIATTVCTKAMPFRIQFLSDQWEFAAIEAGANVGIVGFKLRYFQTSC